MSSQIIQMTHADYLAHPAYGSSDIIKMGRSFAYWKYRQEFPEPVGRPLVIGTVTHLMLQSKLFSDPLLIDNGVRIFTGGSSKTLAFKSFELENRGYHCVDKTEADLCARMVQAILDEPEAMGYLQGAVPEATVMGNYPGTNVLCKCRPDYLHTGRGLSINVKTAIDASESGFMYSSRDYGYDWQSALYCDILTDQLGSSFDEIHIVVEKTLGKEPCPIQIFSFGDDTLSWARHQIREILAKIPENEKSGIWSKNRPVLRTIDLPIHMRKLVADE